MLVEIGRRLKACLRPYDMAARFGGDEFAVLIDDADAGHCGTVAQKLIACIEEPFSLSGSSIRVGVSIGATIAMPGTNSDSDRLMHHADTAMYEAKMSGDSACHFWNGVSVHTQSVA